MSFSSGTFSINSTGQPVVTGTVISSTVFNAFTADIATGLSTCMLKDGTQTATALVPFASGISTGLVSTLVRTIFTGGVSTPSASTGEVGAGATTGLTLNGSGSTYDVTLLNKSGTIVAGVPTGTTTFKVITGSAVGGATPGAGGLAFPATAVAVADANTLDDYEEGSWTPANPQVSLTVTSASYTKIGNAVFIQADVTWPANADGTVATITGLPFAASARHFALSIQSNQGLAVAGSVTASTSTIGSFTQPNGTALTNGNFNTTNVKLSGHYLI